MATRDSGEHWTLYLGDCLEVLREFPENSVEACVTDPPYGLSRAPDAAEVVSKWLAGEDYKHRGAGFMGNSWDSFTPGPSIWREVFRVLKPGAHLLAFGGSRTYDLLVLAIRLAGFEVRDSLQWIYGSGFPKGLNVSKALDRAAGFERNTAEVSRSANGIVGFRDVVKGFKRLAGGTPSLGPQTDEGRAWEGWNTALKPAFEPICLARKPLAGSVAENVLAHGTGALNIGASLIGAEERFNPPTRKGKTPSLGSFENGSGEGTTSLGRWPANVLLDEEAAAELDRQSGASSSVRSLRGAVNIGAFAGVIQGEARLQDNGEARGFNDFGGASRFFYTAKAPKSEREAGLEDFELRPAGGLEGRRDGSLGGEPVKRRNFHPTVKPLDLMQYLVKLITPPGGTVLDPFSGSGSTGCAALRAGFTYCGIELSAEYFRASAERLRYFSGENLFMPLAEKP